MRDRQRRRSIKWYLRAGVVVAVGDAAGGWFLHIHNHFDIKAAFVGGCLIIGTLIVGGVMVICWNNTSNHKATRALNDAALAEAVNVVERRQLALVSGSRVCTTTRYIPHRDLEPNRVATARDLLAERTGDISDYRC